MMVFRQRQVSITVVALLLGGWLSVVCQTCLAHLSQNHQPAQTSESSHCSDTAGHEPANPNSDDTHKPYSDACDCDSVAAGIKPTAHNEAFNCKLVALVHRIDRTRIAEGPVSYPINVQSPGYPGLSPIDTYRVQIK